MTVFTLLVKESHIDALSADSALLYDDLQRPLSLSGHTALFVVHPQDAPHERYFAAIPHHLSYNDFLASKYSYLSHRYSEYMPQVAWAQQTNSTWVALIFDAHSVSLQHHLHEAQAISQHAAEQMAIRAWSQYVALLSAIYDAPQDDKWHGLTKYPYGSLPLWQQDALYWNTVSQTVQIYDWDRLYPARAVDVQLALRQSALLWYRLLTQQPTLPRSIVDENGWQASAIGTAISLGTRLIMWQLFTHDWRTNSNYEDIQRLLFSPVQNVLQAWQDVITLTPQAHEDEALIQMRLTSFWDAAQQLGIIKDETIAALVLDELRLRQKANVEATVWQDWSHRLQAWHAAQHADATIQQTATDKLPENLWVMMNQTDSNQSIEKILEALGRYADDEARYLMRQIAMDTTSPAMIKIEMLLSFLQMEAIYQQSAKHLVTAFEQLQQLTEVPPIRTNSALMQRLGAITQSLLYKAQSILQQAIKTKNWEVIQNAYPASRIIEHQSGYRSFIDAMRTHNPNIPAWATLDESLQTYQALRTVFLQLMQIGSTNALEQAMTSTDATEQRTDNASQILALIQQAITLGIDMSDIIDDSDAMRQQWRQLIDDAMHTLQDSTQLRADIDALEARIEQRTNRLSKQVDELIQRMDEDPQALHEKINALYGEMRTLQEQADEQKANIGMNSEKVARIGRILDDVKERFEGLSGEIARTRQHAAGVLHAYLDWFGKQDAANDVVASLTKVDELVYAMRQCPAVAYDDTLHQQWLTHFEAQIERYQILYEARAKRLRGRQLRNFKADAASQQERFDVCRAEAADKQRAYQQIRAIDDAITKDT